MKSKVLIPALCAAVGIISVIETSSGQIVNYVGSESGLATNNYPVQNWSATNVSKAYDIDDSGRYGTAGYYQIRPTLKSSPSNVNDAVSNGNNLGISAVSNPTLFSTPTFLSSMTGYAGTLVNFGGYLNYLDTAATTEYRQGALSVAVNNGPFNSPAGANSAFFGLAVRLTLNSTVNFRLGLAVDSVGSASFAPNYISISGVFSDALLRDGNADMAFFDISGTNGSTFDVALWQTNGTQSVAALSLVTFDVIPEPSAGLLAMFGLASLGALHVMRKRHRAKNETSKY